MLGAQGELLHVGRCGAIVYDSYAYAKGGGAAREWANGGDSADAGAADSKSWSAGVKFRSRQTAILIGHVAAARAVEGVDWQNAAIEQCFQDGYLQYDSIVVNAIAATHDGLPMTKRVPGKTHSRAEVLVFGRGIMRSQNVANELAVEDEGCQGGTSLVLVGLS